MNKKELEHAITQLRTSLLESLNKFIEENKLEGFFFDPWDSFNRNKIIYLSKEDLEKGHLVITTDGEVVNSD